MRVLAFVLLAALSACAPREAAAPSCDLSVEREIAFTAEGAHDTLSARTLGVSCDKAVGLYVVTAEDGHPIWAWTAPMSRAFGDAYHPSDNDAAQAFLERWAEARLATTATAPQWPVSGGALTTLDRVTYEDIRARDLPMLCHITGTARETCVFWEPGAALAGALYERDLTASPN